MTDKDKAAERAEILQGVLPVARGGLWSVPFVYATNAMMLQWGSYLPSINWATPLLIVLAKLMLLAAYIVSPTKITFKDKSLEIENLYVKEIKWRKVRSWVVGEDARGVFAEFEMVRGRPAKVRFYPSTDPDRIRALITQYSSA